MAVALSLGGWVEIVYAVLLVVAMMGAALSCLGPAYLYAKSKLPSKIPSPLIAALLSLVAYLASLVGFGELVSTVYPAIGYLGLLALACLIYHRVWLFLKKKKGANGNR